VICSFACARWKRYMSAYDARRDADRAE